MDPSKVFCHNPDCPARGKLGRGNIGIHSRKKRRYICHVCGKTFTESKGTVFYRLRYPVEFVTQMITLLAHGCPVAAIVAAFKLDERTVASWQGRAGDHCQQVHEHLVQQPCDLGQVQADEIRVKHQGGIAWLAMALQVSTRLWLGGVVSAHRDGKLITHLIEQVHRCALYRELLFCVDGFSAYVSSIQKVFRTPIFTGKRGRPHLRAWEHVCIVQVMKQVSKKRVVGVIRRVAQGTSEQVQSLLKQTQNTTQAHVAYMERLNGTFRSRIAALVRRGRSLARQSQTLHQAMYLVGTVYNFCAPHKSLRLALYLSDNRIHWIPSTPAIAAGITDHIWTVQELLSYQVPLPLWEPPKQRGRPSKNIQELIKRWIL
jgi:transposase-like protein